MRPITLDELALYSSWPRRMLQATGGDVALDRDWLARREYGEKYQFLLDARDERGGGDYDLVRRLELGERADEVAMSLGDRLYAATLSEAMEASLACLMTTLRPEALLARGAIDLGCGYGYLLHRLKELTRGMVELRGGELVPSGVELAHRLDPTVPVEPFDFYSDTCAPLENADERRMVVTTSYALHQLRSAQPAVDLLAKYRKRIAVVVNLEPEEDHFGEGLLGLLRKRYGRYHNYSADLGRVLRERDDVEIDYVMPAAVGANALLPGTITVWRFR